MGKVIKTLKTPKNISKEFLNVFFGKLRRKIKERINFWKERGD